MTKKKTFKCELCEEEFPLPPDEVWTDEDAEKEFKRLYPGHDMTKVAITCDVCHQKIQDWRAENDTGSVLQ